MKLIQAKGIYHSNLRTFSGSAVVVSEDRITEIGSFSEMRKRHPDIEYVDLSDYYLFPGLINTHVHLEFDSSDAVAEHFINRSAQDRLQLAAVQAEALLMSGVTTVRDAGSSWDLLGLVNPARTPAGILPRIQLCGPPITQSRGHLHFMGGTADTREEIIEAVHLRKNKGCSAVKVMITGGQMTPGSKPEEESYSVEEIRILTDEAHALGMQTAAHSMTAQGFSNAVNGNIDSIEHGAFVVRNHTNNLLERVYDPILMESFRGIKRFLMRGVSTAYHLLDAVRGSGEPRDELSQYCLDQEEKMFDIFRSICEVGFIPVVGTDAGVTATYFDETFLELELMQQRGGMTAAEVMDAVTLSSAACLGLSEEIGRIEPGYAADLIGLRTNPLHDVYAFRTADWVMKGGTIVKDLRTDDTKKTPVV